MFLIGAGTKKTHKEYQRKIGQSNIIIIKKGDCSSKMLLWVADERAGRSVWCESERV